MAAAASAAGGLGAAVTGVPVVTPPAAAGADLPAPRRLSGPAASSAGLGDATSAGGPSGGRTANDVSGGLSDPFQPRVMAASIASSAGDGTGSSRDSDPGQVGSDFPVVSRPRGLAGGAGSGGLFDQRLQRPSGAPSPALLVAPVAGAGANSAAAAGFAAGFLGLRPSPGAGAVDTAKVGPRVLAGSCGGGRGGGVEVGVQQLGELGGGGSLSRGVGARAPGAGKGLQSSQQGSLGSAAASIEKENLEESLHCPITQACPLKPPSRP